MVEERFKTPALAGLMAVVSVAAFVPYLAIQMKGAGYILESVTRGSIPEWVGSAVVYGVVMVYVLRSGVLGVGWTNTFQGCVHDGAGLGPGSLPAVQALRRDPADVRADRGRGGPSC